MSTAPRVLVIRGGAIGDFILTLPAIRLLRENLAACHLEVLGYPGIADLALTAGLADAVRSLGHRDIAPLFAPAAPVSDEVAHYLRSFNLVVSYLFDPDGHFRGNLERLGVKTLIECPHRIQPGQGHAAAQLARPLERLALFLDHPAPQFPDLTASLDSTTAPRPAAFLLHPGSGSSTKTWPLHRWAEVLASLAARRASTTTPLPVILITGEAEEERGVLAATAGLSSPSLAISHWHQIPLTSLVPLLQQQAHHGARFLGHDSGISHLAAACGLPCTLLFGPTDPALWAPQNPGVQVIQSPSDQMNDLPVFQVLQSLEPS